MLLLISGLPGSGKSTLARAYVQCYGGTHINSDLIRAALGLRGHYQPGDKERVYAAMLSAVQRELAAGGFAVVDSTFYKKSIREPFETAAANLGVPVIRVWVRAAETTIRQRLQTPRTDSEADFAVYEKIRDEYEVWSAPYLTLWSDEQSLDALVDGLYQYIQIQQ